LFPLGATSYPLTRGIRVEIAATVIIFLAGILSQSKLWKLIKERREQRTAERLQDERNLEKEEENVGKRIENATAADRKSGRLRTAAAMLFNPPERLWGWGYG
jgi:hypothetical protein